MKVTKDGDMYCVSSDRFTNLQESDEYFFISKLEWLSFLQRFCR